MKDTERILVKVTTTTAAVLRQAAEDEDRDLSTQCGRLLNQWASSGDFVAEAARKKVEAAAAKRRR